MLVTERDRLREELVELGEKYGRERSGLLPILQEIQRRHHYISPYCMQIVADLLGLHPVEVHSVVSFYSFLNERPQGQFVIRLCPCRGPRHEQVHSLPALHAHLHRPAGSGRARGVGPRRPDQDRHLRRQASV